MNGDRVGGSSESVAKTCMLNIDGSSRGRHEKLPSMALRGSFAGHNLSKSENFENPVEFIAGMDAVCRRGPLR